jgi:hypothetical protein
VAAEPPASAGPVPRGITGKVIVEGNKRPPKQDKKKGRKEELLLTALRVTVLVAELVRIFLFC